jgi:hypothetical protein
MPLIGTENTQRRASDMADHDELQANFSAIIDSLASAKCHPVFQNFEKFGWTGWGRALLATSSATNGEEVETTGMSGVWAMDRLGLLNTREPRFGFDTKASKITPKGRQMLEALTVLFPTDTTTAG